MYDRAPRTLTLTVGCTDSHLGPGAYELPSQGKRLRDSHAPFLSLASRGLQSISQNADSDLPGPGYYDIDKMQKSIKGGQSLQYREKRFKEIRTDTPGPGTYCQPPLLGQDICYVKRSSKVPAAQNETYSTMKYKGVHFGNLTEKRHQFKPHEGPGPADYDVIQESAVHYENINIRKEDQRKYDLYIPRYHEVIVLQEEKKGVPGPGQYDIKSQFEKADSTAISESHHVPFLSLSQRFAPVKTSTPAPGTYNETRCALESLKKAAKTKNIPFGRTAVRFTQDYRLQKSPGPAFYNVLNYSIATQSFKKALLEKKKKGGFGSSVPRLLYLVKREAFHTPGPADYQVKESTEEPRKKKKQLSVFASATERIPAMSTEAPPPGSYDVQKSFEKSQCKSEYMPPRTAVAKRKHASFLSGTFRQGISKNEDNAPGPGSYNPEAYNSNVKSPSSVTTWVSKEERFKQAKDDTPGPGAYELSPLFRDTVLKRTFNATLNNPVVIQVDSSFYRPLTSKQELFCLASEQSIKQQKEALITDKK
uniref:Sperm tail PG-rich repeat containing 2 n=1 Tax=Salvator merianae TaxID=96440 RepID=A0A8D0DQT3_SALMN